MRNTAPLWVWGIVSMPALFFANVHGLARLVPFFSLLSIVFVIAGRRELRRMLAGHLTVARIGLVGIGASFVMLGIRWLMIAAFTGSHASSVFVFDPSHASLAINVLAPIREELFFQAVLQTTLQKIGGVSSIALTSLIFALYHVPSESIELWSSFGTMLRFTSELFAMLVVLATIRQVTKSLGAALIAHGSYNALITYVNLVPPW